MAFDPVQEDCLRLILAAMEREGADPASDAAFIERASEAYRLDPATLIHTDRDRSFHLVARKMDSNFSYSGSVWSVSWKYHTIFSNISPWNCTRISCL